MIRCDVRPKKKLKITNKEDFLSIWIIYWIIRIINRI